MFAFARSFFFLAVAWLLTVPTFASSMTFQVTGFDPPGFEQTVHNAPLGPFSIYLLYPSSSLPTMGAIDLSAGGSTLLASQTFGSGHNATEEDYVATNWFSVQGLLKTSSTDTGIPITMTGNATGTVSLLTGFSAPWAGGFSGTVNSVTFPTGMPTSETQDLLNELGNLSRFHINAGIVPNYSGQEPTYTLSMSFNVDPNESPVPEPGSLVLFALLATGYGVYRVRSRNTAA